MDDDAAIIVASRFLGEPLSLRVVTDWEKRCMELALQLRQSNRLLREAEEALQAGREAEGKTQEIGQRLESARRQHLQELAFHLERQRQQYALDTAAHLDVLRERLRKEHEEEAARRVRQIVDTLQAEQVAHVGRLKEDHDAQVARLKEEDAAQVARLKEEHVAYLERAVTEQKEQDDLAHTAQLVEVMAQLKEADVRRRNEKRELADKLKGELAVVSQQRDELLSAMREAQAELAGLRTQVPSLQGFRERYEEEAKARKEAGDQVATLQRQLTETRKQQAGESSKASLKLKGKLAKLQKDHHELLLIHKQTLEYAREEKLRCGKLEVAKEDSEREARNLEKQNTELQKLHDASVQALTVARQELLAQQERIKDSKGAQQKEVETLRVMLKASNEALQRSEGQYSELRMVFDETTQGAYYKAVQERTFAALDTAKADVDALKARLQASPPHRSDTEFNALRAMLQTANAEKDAMHAELKAVRAAFDQTDQGIHLYRKQKEVQKLHRVLGVLIAEIKDSDLVEQLMDNMMREGFPDTAQVIKTSHSASKRAKKAGGARGK